MQFCQRPCPSFCLQHGVLSARRTLFFFWLARLIQHIEDALLQQGVALARDKQINSCFNLGDFRFELAQSELGRVTGGLPLPPGMFGS